jgi:hypothetical protein
MTHYDVHVVMYGDKFMSQPVACSNTIEINRYTKFLPPTKFEFFCSFPPCLGLVFFARVVNNLRFLASFPPLFCNDPETWTLAIRQSEG